MKNFNELLWERSGKQHDGRVIQNRREENERNELNRVETLSAIDMNLTLSAMGSENHNGYYQKEKTHKFPSDSLRTRNR